MSTATGLVAAYYLLPMGPRLTGSATTALVLGLLALLALFTWQIRSIARSRHPRLRAVEALATTLPLFLLLFATTYYLLERSEPGSFSEPLTRTDSLYFALSMFSTVGFGDITAYSQTARVIVMTQMTADILLIVLAARLVVRAVETALHHRGG
ncbi:potassium channel family protein [Streptomyces sp. NPDC097640]|uniref:potassium channel family protein n=1 Tax=Streptomyces sp. NPDC097640 TaxID=3157229 RepID=UPI00332CFDE9